MNTLPRTFISAIFILLFVVYIHQTSAQQIDKNIISGKISGRIFDKVTNNPLQFASFIITSVKDSTIVFGSESDSLGKFLLNNIPFGVYKAKVSLIGYQPRTRKNIILNKFKSELRIDTLMLMPLKITKEEVQVIAQKERIVYDKDNKNIITINPDKDWGVNAFELLENTPMVHIDFDEQNITLMGNSGAVIYVNGMPGRYSGIESVEDLKLMSVDEIDKFELVINPEAEYGVSAPAGIINIVPKKNNKSSYTGNTTMGGNSDNKYNGNISGRYNSPTFSTGINYINGYSDHTLSNSLVRQLTFQNSTGIMNQSSETENRDIANRFALNATLNLPNDYLIRNTIQYNEGYNSTNKNYENIYSGNDYHNSDFSKNLLKLFTTGITFTKPMSGKGNRLTASFAFSNNHMNIENNYDSQNLLSYQTLTDTSISGNDISDNTNKFINWGITYNNMFNQYFNFSAGYMGAYKGMLMNSDYFQYNSLIAGNTELDNKKIRQHNYDNTHMISSGVSGTIMNFQYTFRINSNLKYSVVNNNTLNNSFRYNLVSFDPIINISTDIARGHNIGFGYSNSTSFPQNYQLNPFTDYSDTTNIITGNPELKAGSNKNYSIHYMFLDNGTVLNFWSNYNIGRDLISSLIIPVSPGITKTTFANVSGQNVYSIRIFLSKNLFKCLDLEPSFSANKSKYTGIGIQNGGTSWGSSLYSMLSFSNLKFETNINYSSASYTVQEKTKPDWSMDAGAKLLLLHKTLSLTLRASDIFNTRNSNNSQSGTGLLITN
ncbi:MAG: outer membrane beta-barrel protein, partial [Ignavibacteriaceae bacterium]|nr:outer membrane beta-barrel protein [Ignavibacteriaceae bacterium]